MIDRTFLSWPFFDERHRELAAKLEDWCSESSHHTPAGEEDAACRTIVAQLGKAGFLKLCVGDGIHRPDVRSLALCRETFARHRRSDRFCVCDAGPGLRRYLVVRHRRTEARVAAQGGQRRGHRRLRNDRAGMRVGRREHVDVRDARRQRMGLGRRKDLHLEWRDRPLLRDLRADWRGRRGWGLSAFIVRPVRSPSPSGSMSSRRILSRG